MNDPVLTHDAGQATLDLLPYAAKVIDLGSQMADLMAEENDVLANRDVSGHKNIVLRKQSLLLDYQSAIKVLIQNRDQLIHLPAADRARLKATSSRLDAIAVVNRDKLAMAASATQKIMQVMMDQMRREVEQKNPRSYTAQKSVYGDERAPKSPAALIKEQA